MLTGSRFQYLAGVINEDQYIAELAVERSILYKQLYDFLRKFPSKVNLDGAKFSNFINDLSLIYKDHLIKFDQVTDPKELSKIIRADEDTWENVFDDLNTLFQFPKPSSEVLTDFILYLDKM
jgi:hypothetical protein